MNSYSSVITMHTLCTNTEHLTHDCQGLAKQQTQI